jgi:hypothetical protein
MQLFCHGLATNPGFASEINPKMRLAAPNGADAVMACHPRTESHPQYQLRYELILTARRRIPEEKDSSTTPAVNDTSDTYMAAASANDILVNMFPTKETAWSL